MLVSCSVANLTLEWDFSQTTTTHHFILTPNGGIVQVTASDPQNTQQIDTIQMHKKHIAQMFSEGNFLHPSLCA